MVNRRTFGGKETNLNQPLKLANVITPTAAAIKQPFLLAKPVNYSLNAVAKIKANSLPITMTKKKTMATYMRAANAKNQSLLKLEHGWHVNANLLKQKKWLVNT